MTASYRTKRDQVPSASYLRNFGRDSSERYNVRIIAVGHGDSYFDAISNAQSYADTQAASDPAPRPWC